MVGYTIPGELYGWSPHDRIWRATHSISNPRIGDTSTPAQVFRNYYHTRRRRLLRPRPVRYYIRRPFYSRSSRSYRPSRSWNRRYRWGYRRYSRSAIYPLRR